MSGVLCTNRGSNCVRDAKKVLDRGVVFGRAAVDDRFDFELDGLELTISGSF